MGNLLTAAVWFIFKPRVSLSMGHIYVFYILLSNVFYIIFYAKTVAMLDKLKMANRLQLAREKKFTARGEAALWLGVPYATYSGNENGSTPFGLEAAANYARRFNVSLDWLVFGRGRGPAIDEQDRVARLYALLDRFDELPQSAQDQLIAYAQAVVDRELRDTATKPTS